MWFWLVFATGIFRILKGEFKKYQALFWTYSHKRRFDYSVAESEVVASHDALEKTVYNQWSSASYDQVLTYFECEQV